MAGFNRRRNSKVKNIFFLVLIVALIGVTGFVVFTLEQRSQPQTTEAVRGDSDTRKALTGLQTLEYNGEKYRQRRGLTTILLMGIDQYSNDMDTPEMIKEAPSPNEKYRNGGQADFLRLLVIDSKNKRISQIEINRDTMTPVTVLGVLGNRTGKRTMQICLAHHYGDGGAQSCELEVDAVENLLYGNHIDSYFALDLDGISELNDFVGGVTVTLEDDFSHLDPTMVQGATIQLKGIQAEYFVRQRMSIGVGTNEARMVRQQQYMTALQEKLIEKIKSEPDAADELYDYLSTFFTTDMSKGRLVNELNAGVDYEIDDPQHISGEYKVDPENSLEFYADDEDLQRIIVDTFYDKA